MGRLGVTREAIFSYLPPSPHPSLTITLTLFFIPLIFLLIHILHANLFHWSYLANLSFPCLLAGGHSFQPLPRITAHSMHRRGRETTATKVAAFYILCISTFTMNRMLMLNHFGRGLPSSNARNLRATLAHWTPSWSPNSTIFAFGFLFFELLVATLCGVAVFLLTSPLTKAGYISHWHISPANPTITTVSRLTAWCFFF